MNKAINPKRENSKIIIGISSCLLGNEVRFDGGHKNDRFVSNTLSQFVEFMTVCPEIEIGMGVPRESVRLCGDHENPKMLGSKSGIDWTNKMVTHSKKRVKQKRFIKLSGFILKNRSPSCGMERVKVYETDSNVNKLGVGLFAKELLNEHPDLPIEEEGRLSDPVLRENFIERIFAFKRLQELYNKKYSRKSFIEFHTKHKYSLLAHSPEYYRRLGKLIAAIDKYNEDEFKKEYRHLFMKTLTYKASVKKNTNVLQHIAGFLKKQVHSEEKLDIHQAINDYHQSLVPLIVPITLLKHFIKKYKIEYIENQYYLNPHPKELMLRNHV